MSISHCRVRLGCLALEIAQQPLQSLGVGDGVFPLAKIADYLLDQVGLPLVFPAVEDVIVNSDWEQHVLLFAILPLEGALDFSKHGWALQGILGADDDELVVNSYSTVNFAPHGPAPLCILWKEPAPNALTLEIGVEPLNESLVFCRVTYEA